jgi:hypothetical protein
MLKQRLCLGLILLFRLASELAAAPQVIVPRGGATAAGRLVDEKGVPVSGAEVRLSPVSDHWAWPRPEERRAVSDAAGRFRFEGLGAGMLELWAAHRGFAPATLSDIKVPAEAKTVDLGDLILAAGLPVEGRITDPHGRPVEGAEVRIYGTSPGPYLPPLERSVSGADGHFLLNDQRRGGILDLSVAKAGYVPKKVSRVEVAAAEPLHIELAAARALTGRIVGPRGEPVPRASISSVQSQEIRTGSGFSSRSTRTGTLGTTDGDGRFRLDNLEEGTLDLQFWAPGYKRRRISGIDPGEEGASPLEVTLEQGESIEGQVTGDQGDPLSNVQVVALLKSPSTPLEVVSTATSDAGGRYRLGGLDPGHYILKAERRTGEETSAEIDVQSGVNQLDLVFRGGMDVDRRVPQTGQGAVLTGHLRGFASDELHDLRISAVLRRKPVQGRMSPSQSGYLSGETYRVAGLTPGVWTVTASVSRGRTVESTVEIEPGLDFATLDLEAPDGLTLTGRLQVDGTALSGAHIIAVAQGRDKAASSRSETWSAHDGSFRLTGLRPGRFQIVGSSLDGLGFSRVLDLKEDRDIPFDIATGALTGHVLTAAGQPVADAVLAIDGGDPSQGAGFSGPNAHSDEQGSFTLPHLTAGSYKITVRKEGFAPTESRIVVTPGGTVEAEVVLKEVEH